MLARILSYGMIRQLAAGSPSHRYHAPMPVIVISQNVPGRQVESVADGHVHRAVASEVLERR